jgi:hypothetical protein
MYDSLSLEFDRIFEHALPDIMCSLGKFHKVKVYMKVRVHRTVACFIPETTEEFCVKFWYFGVYTESYQVSLILV